MPLTPIEENDFLFLLFDEGMLPVRVSAVNVLEYDYDPTKEIQDFAPLSPGEYRNIGVLASTLLNAKDLLLFSQPDMLLHVSFGISPAGVKMFQSYPQGKKLRTFSTFTWSSSDTAFGSVSGAASPLMNASERGGLMILPQTEPGFELLNSEPVPVSPIFRLGLRFFGYEFITDASYCFDMVNHVYPRGPKSYSMGNAEAPFSIASNIRNLKKGVYLIIPYNTASPSDIVTLTNSGGA